MVNFSERYKLSPDKEIQLNDVDITLFNRIWNLYFNREYESGGFIFEKSISITEILLDSFGCTYKFPDSSFDRHSNIDKLHNYLIDAPWYEIYDFIERYIECLDNSYEKKILEKSLNKVLEEEKSGYRMVKGLITPITNSSELETIKKAMTTKFDTVNVHFEKSMKLYSKRKNPDYENSIKEAISAVESMCCIINGKDSTLSDAIKKIKDKGVHIHPAMVSSFCSLYGYTSDEKGIRHAGIDFAEASAEDAKYMLVSCSAFVNYLIEKWTKINQ